MTIHTDEPVPPFDIALETEIHLRCLSPVNAWLAAECRDDVRIDLAAMHSARRAGYDVVPYLGPRMWAPRFALDRAAQALLATDAGRPALEEAQWILPHVHYWLRGGQLITEIVPDERVTVRGLPGRWEVEEVCHSGRIVQGPDDLMAVYVEDRDGGYAFARVLLFTGLTAFPGYDR